MRKGYILSHPQPGDEVVITGLSGKYPASDNVYEFRDNLFGKKDMIDIKEEFTHPEVPKFFGRVSHPEKFDGGFFGVHYKQANVLDTLGRWSLERSFEAILDAGMTMEEIRKDKTGVFIGCGGNESLGYWLYSDPTPLILTG